MKKAIILCTMLMFVFAPVAMAGMTTEQGDMYVSLSGMWQSLSFENGDSNDNDYDLDFDTDFGEPDDTDILMISGGIEYFLSSALSVGVAGMGLWSDPVDMYGLGASCRLNFPGDSNIVPYVGAQYSWLNADVDGQGDGDAQMYGPLAGLRIFMTETANFFVEYQYQLFAGDVDDVLDDSHAVVFGLAYQWEK